MSTPSISHARIVEIGDVTAGIVIAEQGGFRFFSAQRPFDPLDRHVFRSIKQLTAAARERLRRSRSPRKSRSSRAEGTASSSDLILAVPGPFLLPV
jgi:hypothetical protein